MHFAPLFFCLLFSVALTKPVVLTEASFDNLVYSSGKRAFIKFFAPWCGHCKSMKPAWDTLGGEYAGSSSVLIADVDCTEEQALCKRFGVSGYPTVKYWGEDSPKEGSDYSQGRDLESLRNFVKENLEVKCTISDPSSCTEKEQEYISKMAAKSPEQAKKELGRLEGMAGNKMTAEQKAWLKARVQILKQQTA
eukprot:EG_transcript_26168